MQPHLHIMYIHAKNTIPMYRLSLSSVVISRHDFMPDRLRNNVSPFIEGQECSKKELVDREAHCCVTTIWYTLHYQIYQAALFGLLSPPLSCMCASLLPPAQWGRWRYEPMQLLSVASLRRLCLSRKRFCNSGSVACVHENKDWPLDFVMTQSNFRVHFHKYMTYMTIMSTSTSYLALPDNIFSYLFAHTYWTDLVQPPVDSQMWIHGRKHL